MSLCKFDTLLATKHGTNVAIVYELLWELSQANVDYESINLFNLPALYPFLGIQEIELAVAKLIQLKAISVKRPDDQTLNFKMEFFKYYPIILSVE